ncbi:MAG: hypothetical protein ACT4ON_15795 [Bacteroidota bacterium]
MTRSGFKNSVYILSFLLIGGISKAQQPLNISKTDMAKVFEQMNNWFKNTPAYSLTVTHASYENHTTTVPVEKSVGYFKKDKESYHSFLLGIRTIQNIQYKIVVDTSDKILMVANPDQLIWNSYTLDDYTLILKNCIAIKMSTNGTDKRYSIHFSEGYPLSSYEFLISPDGLPKEIIWYYNEEVSKDEDNENSQKVKPRVCITFSGYRKKPVLNYKEEFDSSPYFTKANGKLVVSSKYKNFKFSDQRLNIN